MTSSVSEAAAADAFIGGKSWRRGSSSNRQWPRNSACAAKLYKRGHIVHIDHSRPQPALEKPVKHTTTIVTHGRTADAYLMDPAIREAMLAEYGGTRLARQELEGESLEDVEGALWSGTNIERHRWTVLPGGGYRPPGGLEDVTKVPEMARVVVGVDPAGGQGEGNDETGIVVCGRVGYGLSAQYFVLGDYSLRGSPMAWASAVAVAFDKHEADRVVAEKNFGGDMVEHTLRSVRPNLAIKMVTASRGKTQRARAHLGVVRKGPRPPCRHVLPAGRPDDGFRSQPRQVRRCQRQPFRRTAGRVRLGPHRPA